MKWYQHPKIIKRKEDKIVVKKYDKQNQFEKSIILPTQYYPLNGDYEVFSAENTTTVTDKNVLEIINSVPYILGHCYTNTKLLAQELRTAGYDAKVYCGWIFVDFREYPVHHCWLMLGESLIDLSDDMDSRREYCRQTFQKEFEELESVEQARQCIVNFYQSYKKKPNSVRCCPIGVPFEDNLYIGCECDADEGRKIYQRLIKEYPDHEAYRNCNQKGQNITQQMMLQKL